MSGKTTLPALGHIGPEVRFYSVDDKTCLLAGAEQEGPAHSPLFNSLSTPRTHLLVEVSDSVTVYPTLCSSYVHSRRRTADACRVTGFAMRSDPFCYFARPGSRISGGGTTFHSIHDAARQRDNDGRDKNRA